AAAGMAWATVRRAKDRLKVIVERKGFGSDGEWRWRLPPPIDAHSPHRGSFPEKSTYDKNEHLRSTTGDAEDRQSPRRPPSQNWRTSDKLAAFDGYEGPNVTNGAGHKEAPEPRPQPKSAKPAKSPKAKRTTPRSGTSIKANGKDGPARRPTDQ